MIATLKGRLTVGTGSSKEKQDVYVIPSLQVQEIEADAGKELGVVTVASIPDTFGSITFNDGTLHIE